MTAPLELPHSLWAIDNWDTVSAMLVQHIWLAMIPIGAGLIIAIPLGLLLCDSPRARAVSVFLASVIYTVPSLALFLIIPGILGTQLLSPVNVVVALSLYSTCLFLRSVFQALDAVPRAVVDAGVAIGHSRVQRKLRIDMPLAIPVLTASARVVAVTNISLVTVGAVIGVGGLGGLFTAGYQRDFPEEIVTGIVLTILLGLIVDRLIALMGRWLAPWARPASRKKSRRRVVAHLVTTEA